MSLFTHPVVEAVKVICSAICFIALITLFATCQLNRLPWKDAPAAPAATSTSR